MNQSICKVPFTTRSRFFIHKFIGMNERRKILLQNIKEEKKVGVQPLASYNLS